MYHVIELNPPFIFYAVKRVVCREVKCSWGSWPLLRNVTKYNPFSFRNLGQGQSLAECVVISQIFVKLLWVLYHNFSFTTSLIHWSGNTLMIKNVWKTLRNNSSLKSRNSNNAKLLLNNRIAVLRLSASIRRNR